MPPAVELREISKYYDAHAVVDDLSVTVEQGEFFSLLGSSGCGKTTCLRIVAGFESGDKGTVWINGQCVNKQPAHKRDVNLVFQNYALFPHMTVQQNVAFGLEMKKYPKREIATKVDEALAMVQLDHFANRLPAQLSGGQQQRVALARALVVRPSVILLDEPLGALDLQLRRTMQIELKKLQRQTGITFIYVTHDQEEALSLSDRIAVMNHGKIEQIGSPRAIYEHPSSEFVAKFIGETNLFPVLIREQSGNRIDLQLEANLVTLISEQSLAHGLTHGKLCIRPETISLHTTAPDLAKFNSLPGTIEQRQYLGNDVRYWVTLLNGQSALARIPAHHQSHFEIGEHIHLSWPIDHGHLIFKHESNHAPR